MTFASSFFVAPTLIDFSTVFLKFDLNNASVYGTLIGLCAVWILVIVWARRKDMEDKERVSPCSCGHLLPAHFGSLPLTGHAAKAR